MNPAMEALQARFQDRCSRDLAVLRRHLAADDPGAPEVETTAHKLAGAAALFGHPDIGLAARDVDSAFGAGRAPGRDLIETLIARLAPVAVADPSAAPAEPVAEAPGGGETILLVEDDDLLRAHAASQLQRLGYQVISVAGGEEALARLESRPPVQLLFTDLTLPGPLDGDALAREARVRWPGVRVLFTSGKAPRDAGSGDGTGRPFLPKPYRRDALAAMVRRALDAPAPPA